MTLQQIGWLFMRSHRPLRTFRVSTSHHEAIFFVVVGFPFFWNRQRYKKRSAILALMSMLRQPIRNVPVPPTGFTPKLQVGNTSTGVPS